MKTKITIGIVLLFLILYAMVPMQVAQQVTPTVFPAIRLLNTTPSRFVVTDASGNVTNTVAATGTGAPVLSQGPVITDPVISYGTNSVTGNNTALNFNAEPLNPKALRDATSWDVAYHADCTVTNNWVVAGTGAVLTTTNMSLPLLSGATQPTVVTVTGATGSTSLQHRPTTAQDLTGKYIRVKIQQNHEFPAATSLGYYSINLYSETNFTKVSTTTTFFLRTAYTNQCSDLGVGIHEVFVPVSELPLGTLTDYSAITQIRVTCAVGAGTATDWGLQTLDVISPRAASCVVRVDWNSILYTDNMLDVCDYARDIGVPLTVGIGFGTVGVPAQMTLSAIDKVVNAGHEIVVYGGHNPTITWDTWTADYKQYYFGAVREILRQLNIDWNGVFFCPGGAGQIYWDKINLLEPGIISMISGSGPFPPNTVSGVYPLRVAGTTSLHWTGFIDGPATGGLPDWLAEKISECETNRGVLVLGSHVATANDIDQLKSSLVALRSSSMLKLRFSDLIPKAAATGTARGVFSSVAAPSLTGALLSPFATGGSVTLGKTNAVYLVNVDAQTITLPTAVGIRGRTYTIKTIAPAETATITNALSQTIDGATSYSLSASNKFVTVISDNAAWWIIGNN